MAFWRGGTIATAICLTVAACASKNNSAVRIIDGNGSSTATAVQPIRALSNDEIKKTIAGRTWQYTRGDDTGIINYNVDGTSAYQDDVKGSGTGAWSVKDGQLCESFDKAPALQCGQFKSTGDAYFAGKTRLVEMKL
jgi:hypothetical protein